MKTLGRFARKALGLTCVLVTLTGCSLLPQEKVEEVPTLIEPPPSRAVTYTVEKKTIVEEIRGLARVAPTLETNMYFKQNARLAVLNVEPGQRVKKGDVLAQLETGSLEHQLDLAEIDLEMAKLRLSTVETGGAPIDVKMQKLNVEKAQLDVQNLKERLEAATLRAPHDGIVQSVRTQVGEIAQEYQTLMVVADPTALELQIEMRRSEDINRLARGQKALVEVKRDQWEPATVFQITQSEDDRSSLETSIVHVELEGQTLADAGLQLGDLVSTRLIVQEKTGALVIPRAALREFMGRRYVRVLDGDARREVDVEVGIQTPTDVEILKGLSEGDIVIGQ